MSRVLALVSVALLLVGTLLGLLPTSVGGVNCGSAFVSSDDAGVKDFSDAINADRSGVFLDGSLTTTADACAGARSGRLTPAIILLVLGGVGAIAALGVYQAENPGS